MTAPAAVVDAVRTFFRAQLTGNVEQLATVCLPHPELGSLAPQRAPIPAVASLLRDISRMQVSAHPSGDERSVVHAYWNGTINVLLVRDTADGPRIDARFPIEAMRPDDDCRGTARAFYRAMLVGDGAALFDLAFDPSGVELLAENRPPAGEHGQLEHVAEMMALVRLQKGDSYLVPKGIEFVNGKHAELGIVVFSALTPEGECTFMLRQRDGAWKVIPFHFIQAAVRARGGSLTG